MTMASFRRPLLVMTSRSTPSWGLRCIAAILGHQAFEEIHFT